MSETIELNLSGSQGGGLRGWWLSRSFIQKRMLRVLVSLLVWAICVPLYYLGLFGSVDGPLNPARIGEWLAGLGATRTHSMILFLSFLIISVSWNWVYNLVSLLRGSRLTCTRTNAGGSPCGAGVTRSKTKNQKQAVYICTQGHRRADAHFHPVRKGTLSHSIWVISLVFCIIVLISSY